MKIRVRLWGGLTDVCGFHEEVLDVDPDATAADVRGLLEARAPGLSRFRTITRLAVNADIATGQTPLADGDELSLLPPVAGGQEDASTGAPDLIGLRSGPLDPAEAIAAVTGPDSGGIGVFIGTVRRVNEGHAVQAIDYSAFADMAEPTMRAVVAEARARWPLDRVALLHSVGRLAVGDASVAVAVSSMHRAEALEACRYIINQVKDRAAIWKQEFGPDGTRWVNLPEPSSP